MHSSGKIRFSKPVILLAVATAVGFLGVLVYPLITTRSDDEFRILCKKLRENETWPELIECATEWSKTTEMPDEALLFLAEGEFELGNPLKAIECLLSVPEESSRCFPALIAACDLQFGELNRPLDGVVTLQRMISRNPSSISSRQRLIFFYAMTLQREKMLDAILDAIRARAEPPDVYAYLMIADELSFSNGFSKNSEWLKSDPDSELFSVARTVQLLNGLESSDSPENNQALTRCRETYEGLRKKYPQNFTLLEAAISRAASEFDLATVQELITQAPNPKTSVILRWEGWLNFQNDEFEQSLAALQQSIEAFPLDWETWHQLSACKRRLGDTEGASSAAQIAIAGKAIRKTVLQLEDVSAIRPETLESIASFAASCGMDEVSLAILTRLRAGQTPK